MIHEKLLERFPSLNEETFDYSTRYLLEVTNSGKYLNKLRDWFKVQWPSAHERFNVKKSHSLEDLATVLPSPSKIDTSLRSALDFKTEEIPNWEDIQGFGKLCLVRIFYFGLSEICKEKVPLTWKDYTTHLNKKEESSYPLHKLPFLNYEYHPDTIAAAEGLLADWTSSHSYYLQIEDWFKKEKYKTLITRERGNLLREFPHIHDVNSVNWRTRGAKEDWAHFPELCFQMAFNYYAEEFLGLILPFDYNINRKRDPKSYAHSLAQSMCVDMANTPDETLLIQISQHLEDANIHFRKVENDMNTLDAYRDVPSVQVQLIHGKPADKYTEAELMTLIRDARKAQDDIRDLVNTSTRVKAKHEALEANIAVYVAALDALAD